MNYKNEQPGLEALTHFASRCADLGMVCFTKGDHNGAHEIWDAVFRLGVQLYNERLISRELEIGRGLMSTAANCLNLYYEKENDPRKAAAAKFLISEEAYQKKLANAYHLLTVRGDETYAVKAEGRVVGQYVGDVFEIAESKEADPMFRVEAILHIGCYKFNVYKENEGSYGDQVGARRLLRIMSADTTLPPSVKAAAEAAKNLALEDYHKMSGLSSDSLPGGRLTAPLHHLQLQCPSPATAGRWRESSGQCSVGSLALATTGQPHPSNGVRDTWVSNGCPQYASVPRNTRSGHFSHVVARAGQSRYSPSPRILRNWLAASFAAALDSSFHRLCRPQL